MLYKHLLIVGTFFACLWNGPELGATIIKPMDITSSTELGATRLDDELINGSGLVSDLLTGDSIPGVFPAHNNTAANMWAAAQADNAPYVVFDLGARYDLAGFHVWNFNQTSYTNVGSRDVDVTFSNTSATAGFADLDSFAGASEFAQAPATNSYLGEDKLFATSHSARWVRFDIPLNWGNNSYTVGLSEVRFFGDLYVAPPAPEPSSLLLLGFGGLGMLRFTRRRCRRG